jgi:ABC-type nitrate/sulfonate/bicarbonate transport system permease component
MTATQLRPDDAGATLRAAKPSHPRAPSRYLNMVLGAVGLVVVLVSWQVAAGVGLVDANFSSSPTGALGALVRSIGTGEVWGPLGTTLSTVLWGMVISVVAGIPLGLLIGRNRVLYGLTEPVISIIYSVPYVVFLPIIIFWFGIDMQARIVIVVWSALLPLLINVIAGARNLDASYLQVSQVFCASRLTVLRSVAFPATLPYILAGVRQSVGRALIGAIVAELFMGSDGLGYVVQLKTTDFQMDDAMAAIAVIAVIAVLLNRGVAYVERRFTFWSGTD